MTAEIICVGTELLLGDIVNTNAPYIAQKLAQLGINTYYQSVVGDNRERLASVLDEALERSDLVVLTGGLGPTYDDITKEVVAASFDLPLVLDKTVEQRIQDMLEAICVAYTHNNSKQALVPEGAVLLENTCGTAPGILLDRGGKTVILLPGPPHEMKAMLDAQAFPILEARTGETIRSHSVRIFGVGEAELEDVLHDEMVNASNPTLAPYAKHGEVELRVTARGSSAEECEQMMDPVLHTLLKRYPENIYGIDVPNLQTALVRALAKRGLRIATAESCTGGLVSEYITQVPGASDVFDCGICSYANEIKHKLLGVQQDILETYGAVSEETAAAMASGVRTLSGADLSVSTTGIAGPAGGTAAKPVGTVFIGLADRCGVQVFPLHLARQGSDAREWIRHTTALNALFLALSATKRLHDD